MSEDKTVFCTQCGSENSASAKFCSNCGAKLEQSANAGLLENVETGSENVYAEGLFSGPDHASPYEKVTNAEEIKPDPLPVQDEIHINYGQTADNSQASSTYSAPNQQYYSAGGNEKPEGQGGYIGISIASLVCGIFAIICCCATTFSILLSVAAIALGIVAIVKKYDGKGMAIAGIATGGIAIVLTILAFVSLFATGAYTDFMSEFMDEFYY